MPHQVQSIRPYRTQILSQCPRIRTGILCNRWIRKCDRAGADIPRQSTPQQYRLTTALPQSVHIDDDRRHRISPKLSDSMTARLVLEETVSTASLPEAQRNCTCSLSLIATGRRRASLNEKACSRLRTIPGAYSLPNAGRTSYTWVHCRLTSTP